MPAGRSCLSLVIEIELASPSLSSLISTQHFLFLLLYQMNLREPYFGDDVTPKLQLTCTPSALKIPLSFDLQTCKVDIIPNVKVQLPNRRPSMEPYFQMGIRLLTLSSSLSLFAKLFDIFDYNYLSLSDIVNNWENENGVDSDSDTDPEADSDTNSRNNPLPMLKRISDTDQERFRRFTAQSLARASEKSDEVHFLTFKHNCRATGVPKKLDSSNACDHYGEQVSSGQFDVLSVAKYIRVTPPKYKLVNVEPLDTPCNIQLADYLAKCSNPLSTAGCLSIQNEIGAYTVMQRTNDCYEGLPAPPFLFDSNQTQIGFFI